MTISSSYNQFIDFLQFFVFDVSDPALFQSA